MVHELPLVMEEYLVPPHDRSGLALRGEIHPQSEPYPVILGRIGLERRVVRVADAADLRYVLHICVPVSVSKIGILSNALYVYRFFLKNCTAYRYLFCGTEA